MNHLFPYHVTNANLISAVFFGVVNTLLFFAYASAVLLAYKVCF